jgi:hypothetical protein
MLTARKPRIVPNPVRFHLDIVDETPALVARYALDGTRLLLAKVRHNRLIDRFFSSIATSVASGVRMTIRGIGQIETDEVYVAVSNSGNQFVVPVQAKGGKDQINVGQVMQDMALCRYRFPSLTPRPVAVQFVEDAAGETIVMFELVEREGELSVVDEKHYRLVPAGEIGDDDFAEYRRN